MPSRIATFKRKEFPSKKTAVGIIVVHPQDGTFVELQDTEVFLWELLEKEMSAEELIEKTCHAFAVSRENVTSDIAHFLENALEAGFIEKRLA